MCVFEFVCLFVFVRAIVWVRVRVRVRVLFLFLFVFAFVVVLPFVLSFDVLLWYVMFGVLCVCCIYV